MNKAKVFIFLLFISIIILVASLNSAEPKFISYSADPQKSAIKLYWKNSKGEKLNTLNALNNHIQSKGDKFLFAMNSGMYTPEYNPVGLYIEAGKEISKIKRCNTSKANFCLQPQGIFYITSKNKAGIATPSTFNNNNVIYASQSAPILIQNGKINKNLPTGYKMTRNGIGINKKGHVIMAIGYDVNFPEFAKYFQSQDCTDAMFFDGGVSQILYPEKGIKANATRTSGKFGVMIAVTD